MGYEEQRLTFAGRLDLATQVRRVSMENVAAGYDVRSLTPEGVATFIEVQTSRGDAPGNFELTRSELRFARKHRQQHRLYRLTADFQVGFLRPDHADRQVDARNTSRAGRRMDPSDGCAILAAEVR